MNFIRDKKTGQIRNEEFSESSSFVSRLQKIFKTFNTAVGFFENNSMVFSNAMNMLTDLVDNQWTMNYQIYLVHNCDLPCIDLHGNEFMLKRADNYAFKYEPMGIHVKMTGTDKKGEKLELKGTQALYKTPIKGKPLVIPNLGMFIFYDSEDRYKFRNRLGPNPDFYQAYIDYLFGRITDKPKPQQTPGVHQTVLNLSNHDYYLHMNGQYVLIPKANPDEVIKNIYPEAYKQVTELSATHDILMIKYMVNYETSNDQLRVESTSETPTYQTHLIPIEKDLRTLVKPIVQHDLNLVVFSNVAAAEQFCSAPFNGNLERFMVYYIMKIYEKRLEEKLKEKEEEHKRENKAIANLFMIFMGSGILSSILFFGYKQIQLGITTLKTILTAGETIPFWLVFKSPKAAALASSLACLV